MKKKEFKMFDEVAFCICDDGFHSIRCADDLKNVDFSKSLAYTHVQIQPYAKACAELYNLSANTYGTMRMLLIGIYEYFMNSNLPRLCMDVPINKLEFFKMMGWKMGWQYSDGKQCWIYIDVMHDETV